MPQINEFFPKLKKTTNKSFQFGGKKKLWPILKLKKLFF